MKNNILLILVILTAFSSCRKDNDLGAIDMFAVIDDGSSSKVYIDNSYYACWQNNDKVNINGSEYTVSVEPSDDFKKAKILSVAASNKGYTAGYPFDCFYNITEGGTSATVTIPDVQTYSLSTVYSASGDSYQKLITPMVAHCGAGENMLKFHNIGSVLKIKVTNSTGYNLNVHYVTLSASTANLSGTALVTGVESNSPSMGQPVEGNNSITVDCNNTPIALDDGEDTVIYVVSAPFENQTLTLRVLAKDPASASHGDTAYYTLISTSNSTLSLGHNQLREVDFECTDCGCASETGRCDYVFWGCGTEANPFIISTKNDLLRLRDSIASNKTTYNASSVYYLQIADIDISDQKNWGNSANRAIGYVERPFKSNYDGGRHKVTIGITSLAGVREGTSLFGAVGVTGSTQIIKNLTVDGSISGSATNEQYVGGMIGIVFGDLQLVNCCNRASISPTLTGSSSVVGGLCASLGYYYSSTNYPAGTVLIENCKNYGNVSNAATQTSYSSAYPIGAGGICGLVNEKTTRLTISSCINGGVISGNRMLGGMVGCLGSDNVTMNGCQNVSTGTISGANNMQGGIIGYCNKNITLNSCSNAATVSGSGQVGGLIGNCNVSSGLYSISLVGCSNSNNITGTGNFVGGLIGSSKGGDVSITNCSNSGAISGVKSVGGLVGECLYTLRFKNGGASINSGSVTGSYYTGGMVGFCAVLRCLKGASITNEVAATVTSTSSVTCTTQWATNKDPVKINGYACCGGIAGQCTQFVNHGSMTNKAVVHSTTATPKNAVGGIVGFCCQFPTSQGNYYLGDGSFTNDGDGLATITNSGNVTGGNSTAGIVGYLYKSTDAITVSGTISNSGVISGAQYVGGVIGYCNTNYCDNIIFSGTVSNSGAVSGTNGDVGGILGSPGKSPAFSGSVTNTGAVSGTTRVGGVLAGEPNSIVFSGTQKNTGSITGSSEYVGGIFAKTKIATISGTTINEGNITGTDNVGGIGGHIVTGDDAVTSISGSITNNGEIRGTYNTGGVFGCVAGNGTEGMNYTATTVNSKLVSGTYSVGGIVGFWGNTGTLSHCKNNGKIIASSYYDSQACGVGGIVGTLSLNKTRTIDSCINNNDSIKATNGNVKLYAGGIVGVLRSSGGTLTINNCASIGIIHVKACFGASGIMGGNLSTLIIYNSYSNNTIVTHTSNTTAVAGLVVSNNTGGIEIRNCYFGGHFNLTKASNYGPIVYKNAGKGDLDVDFCYADTNGYKGTSSYAIQGTVEFILSGTNAGDLRGSIAVHGGDRKTLYDALHNWHLDHTAYSDWKNETIPHLAWEPSTTPTAKRKR